MAGHPGERDGELLLPCGSACRCLGRPPEHALRPSAGFANVRAAPATRSLTTASLAAAASACLMRPTRASGALLLGLQTQLARRGVVHVQAGWRGGATSSLVQGQLQLLLMRGRRMVAGGALKQSPHAAVRCRREVPLYTTVDSENLMDYCTVEGDGSKVPGCSAYEVLKKSLDEVRLLGWSEMCCARCACCGWRAWCAHLGSAPAAPLWHCWVVASRT